MARKPDAEAFRTITDARPDDETIPGLLILRTEGRKTFASVPSVAENLSRLVQAADPEVVVFDCSGIPDFEYTVLRAPILHLAGRSRRV